MIQVRSALRRDVPELLRLMKALARFEAYAEEFAVTERELETRGFGAQPQFFAQLAIDTRLERIIGMAVCYLVPFTYDLRPTLVLKELYVDQAHRGRGAGLRLLASVAGQARRLGCGRLRWDVFSGNAAAERFYHKLGGRREQRWIAWGMDAAALETLAEHGGELQD